MGMKDYDLYLFDFDNTLFDSKPRVEAVLRAILALKGETYDPSRFSEYLNKDLDVLYGGRNNEETEMMTALTESILASMQDAAVPFPEVGSVLRELKRRGKRIGIVSGSSRDEIHRYLRANDLDDIPEVVVGWYETERHKPYPDPLALAFSFFDVPKERTVYVGDSANDTGASKAFGVDCVIVNRRNGMGSDGLDCTFEIPSLEGLLRSDHPVRRQLRE